MTSPDSEPVESIIPLITINSTHESAAIAVIHLIIFPIMPCTLLKPGSILQSYIPVQVHSVTSSQFHPGIFSVTLTLIFPSHQLVSFWGLEVGAGGQTKSGLLGSQTPQAKLFPPEKKTKIYKNRIIFFI